AVPALNKVYFGTVPEYGINGGELVEINTETDEVSTYADIIGKQSVITLAFQNNLLIGGSSIWGGLGIQPVEKEAKLFIWDPVKKVKIYETVPVPNAKGLTILSNVPDGLMWGYAGGTLVKLITKSKKVVMTKIIFADKRDSFLWRSGSFVSHPNGMVYG